MQKCAKPSEICFKRSHGVQIGFRNKVLSMLVICKMPRGILLDPKNCEISNSVKCFQIEGTVSPDYWQNDDWWCLAIGDIYAGGKCNAASTAFWQKIECVVNVKAIWWQADTKAQSKPTQSRQCEKHRFYSSHQFIAMKNITSQPPGFRNA